MRLNKSLLVIDVESTGVDPVKDRLIELGVTVLHPSGEVRPRGWQVRFNPGISIPTEASAVHGITDADVANCRPFADYAATIHKKMQGHDLAGYNLRRLDLPILDEEFRRCGLKLDLTGVRILDAQAIYFKHEERTLAAAVQRYCKRSHEDAHGAGADSSATLDVLLAQLEEYSDLSSLDTDALADYCLMDEKKRPADIAGKLYRDPEGVLRWAFSKNKDRAVLDDPGFCDWVLGKDFPESTKECIREELERSAHGST